MIAAGVPTGDTIAELNLLPGTVTELELPCLDLDGDEGEPSPPAGHDATSGGRR